MEKLRAEGIDVIYDGDNALGDRLPAFMERAVVDSDAVLYLCTPNYKKRADARLGGVGYENTVITGELFYRHDEQKFIPVLFDGTWETASPNWANGKLGVDLCTFTEEEFGRIVRAIQNRPASPRSQKAPPVVAISIDEYGNVKNSDYELYEIMAFFQNAGCLRPQQIVFCLDTLAYIQDQLEQYKRRSFDENGNLREFSHRFFGIKRMIDRLNREVERKKKCICFLFAHPSIQSALCDREKIEVLKNTAKIASLSEEQGPVVSLAHYSRRRDCYCLSAIPGELFEQKVSAQLKEDLQFPQFVDTCSLPRDLVVRYVLPSYIEKMVELQERDSDCRPGKAELDIWSWYCGYA